MARLVLFLTALLLAVPAIADDDNKGRGSVKKALQADCERQANQQNLIGKERKKFVKNCSKEGKHAQGRSDRDRQVVPPPAQPAAQAATPAPAAPSPAAQSAGTPTAPAATPPVGTAAAQPPAIPQPPKTVITADQKRANCAAEAKRANVAIPARKQYVDQCMAK